MQNSFFSMTELPNNQWEFYWDHIYLQDQIKEKSLRLILLMYKLRSLSKDLALSRTLFFYGPPGCGKTSFVKGLCNEAGKRIYEEQFFFAELNFHKLFSHNYGESEKLIARTFKHIEELATTNCVTFILFDEVESILTERSLTLSDANPVDVFRGVNEVLKEIDHLSHNFPKIFIFATSNMLSAVDKAFIDRADRTFYVGYPDKLARYNILKHVCESVNKNLSANLETNCDGFKKLVNITKNVSGRQLRKLPIEAMSSSDKLCLEPGNIQINDLIKAAKDLRDSRKHKFSIQRRKQF